MVSQTISTIGVGTIGIYMFIKEFYPNPELFQYIGWIPLTSIVILVVMRGAGVLPVLNPLINEMYPTEIRTLSIGITWSAHLFSGFTSVKVFPELKDLIGIHGLCISYAVVGLICILWGAWTIPDNRGKSLVNVEKMYDKKTIIKNIVAIAEAPV